MDNSCRHRSADCLADDTFFYSVVSVIWNIFIQQNYQFVIYLTRRTELAGRMKSYL